MGVHACELAPARTVPAATWKFRHCADPDRSSTADMISAPARIATQNVAPTFRKGRRYYAPTLHLLCGGVAAAVHGSGRNVVAELLEGRGLAIFVASRRVVAAVSAA